MVCVRHRAPDQIEAPRQGSLSELSQPEELGYISKSGRVRSELFLHEEPGVASGVFTRERPKPGQAQLQSD